MANSGCYEGFSAPSVGDTVWQKNDQVGFRTARVVSVDPVRRVAQVEAFPAGEAEVAAAKAAFTAIRSLQEKAASEKAAPSPERKAQASKTDEEDAAPALLGQPVAPTNAFSEPVSPFAAGGLSPFSSNGSVETPTEAPAAPDQKQLEEAAGEAASKASGEVLSKAAHSLPEQVALSDLAPFRAVPLPPSPVADDAACFGGLSAAALLQQLQHRYLRDEIYTSAARVLLAVNPYKSLAHLYSPALIQLYRQWKALARALRRGEPHELSVLLDEGPSRREALARSLGVAAPSVADLETLKTFSQTLREHGRPPPHPYVLAEEAYSHLSRAAVNQTLIVTGQSGAGKTETSKQLMLFLTHAGVERGGSAMLRDLQEAASLRERVLSCNAVFESLGNAATRRNYNSSRVGRLTRLHFGLDGELRGASLETFLLEAARLTSHVQGERTFHVFYELLAGSSEAQREKLRLTTEPADFQMLRSTKLPLPQQKTQEGSAATALGEEFRQSFPVERDKANFAALCTSLRRANLEEEELEHFFQLLAGLLHLSNVAPPETGGTSEKPKLSENSRDSLAIAAQLLGVSTEDLEDGLLQREIRLRGEAIRSVRTPQQVAATRDALIRYIYTRLFSFLVYRLNCSAALRRGKDETDSKVRAIGILDIYGFESFTSGNGLEQLCINWANEKQQQLFVNQVIREEVELFAQQGIAVPAKKSLVSKHFSPEEQAQQKLELRRQNVRSAVGQFRVSIQRSLIDALPNTASLLQQLQQGVFHRLDDSCRLLAQGQNRTDAQFWSDVFAACCATKSPSQASSGNDSLGKVEPHVLFCLKGAQGNRAVEAASRGELLHILEAEQLAALGLLPPNAMASGLGKPVGKALPSSGTKTLAAGGFASAANKAREGLFAVQHFAGTVLYRTEGWIERNNDSVEESLEGLLETSGVKMLKEALEQRRREMQEREGEECKANSRQSRFSSLTKHFLQSVKDLQVQLQDPNMHLHFIRCFVPNEKMAPDRFESAVVLQQLQYSGTVALLHVLHCGFPHRLPLRPLAAELRTKLLALQRRFQAQLQRERSSGQGNQESPAAKRVRLDVTFFDGETVRDRTLVIAALSLVPECSEGAFQCGISLACFKSTAFRAASAFLADPEVSLRSPEDFSGFVGAIQRLRWRVAIRTVVCVNPALKWLQRRAFLMRRIKEIFVEQTLRLLRARALMRRPLLRARRALGLDRMASTLLRAAQRRGLRLWKLAAEAAKRAAEAAAAKAARLAAASAGVKALAGAGPVSVAQKVASVETKKQPPPAPDETKKTAQGAAPPPPAAQAEAEKKVQSSPSPKLDLSKLRPPEGAASLSLHPTHQQASPAWAFRLFAVEVPKAQRAEGRCRMLLHAERTLFALDVLLEAAGEKGQAGLCIRQVVCRQLAEQAPLCKSPSQNASPRAKESAVEEGSSPSHAPSGNGAVNSGERIRPSSKGSTNSAASLLTVAQHPILSHVFVGCDLSAHLILMDLEQPQQTEAGEEESPSQKASGSAESVVGFKRGSTGVPSVALPALGGGWKSAVVGEREKAAQEAADLIHEYRRRFGAKCSKPLPPLPPQVRMAEPRVRVIAPSRWLPRDLMELVRGEEEERREDGLSQPQHHHHQQQQQQQMGFVRTLSLSFANPLTADFVLVLCLAEHRNGREQLVVVFVDLVEQRPLAWLPLFFAEPSLSLCRRKHAAFAEPRLCVPLNASSLASESTLNSPCGTTRRAGRSRGKLLSAAFLQPLGGSLWLAAGPCLLSVFAVRTPQRPLLCGPSSGEEAESFRPLLQTLWAQSSIPFANGGGHLRVADLWITKATYALLPSKSLGSLESLQSLVHFAQVCPLSGAAHFLERRMQRLLFLQSADKRLCLLEWKTRGEALGSEGICLGELRVLGLQPTADFALAFVRVFPERRLAKHSLGGTEKERLFERLSFGEEQRNALRRAFPWEPLALRLRRSVAGAEGEEAESELEEKERARSSGSESEQATLTESTNCGENGAASEKLSACSEATRSLAEPSGQGPSQEAFLSSFEKDALRRLGLALVLQQSGEFVSADKPQAASAEGLDSLPQKGMHLAVCAVPGHCDALASLRITREGELELWVESVSEGWRSTAKVALPETSQISSGGGASP